MRRRRRNFAIRIFLEGASIIFTCIAVMGVLIFVAAVVTSFILVGVSLFIGGF